MKSLVLIAHGSRLETSNLEILRLAETIAEELATEFPIVQAGFLEMATPTIPQAIEGCICEGATHILVLPYFLAAGRHVNRDLPEQVARLRDAHPGVTMEITPHIGEFAGMRAIIREAATQADGAC